MSTPPQRSTASRTRPSTSADEVTSARRPSTSRPWPRSPVSASSTEASSCPQRTTAAPPSASRRAVARPIPSEPPVTTATFPSSSATGEHLRRERETALLVRAELERRAVRDRLGEAVSGVARERLEPDVPVPAVPRVAGRPAELLPEPEVRHHVRVPLDPQPDLVASDLVPGARREGGEVD